MKIKLSPLAICLAFGLSAVAGSSQANWITDYIMMKNKKKKDDAVTLPVEPPPGNPHPSKGYPNGRGWSAVEYDFIDTKRRIAEVKEDTEEILLELEDVDADLDDLLDGQEDLMEGQKDLMEGQKDLMDGQDALSEQIDDLAGAVEAQANVLEVQVRVGAIIGDEVSIDSSSVVLYVQVIQNGAGVTGLTADAFSYTNVTPNADAASYCGNELCFNEPAGSNGLYILDINADAAGNFAATVAVGIEGDDVSIDSNDSNGASIVTFEIEEPVLEPNPA